MRDNDWLTDLFYDLHLKIDLAMNKVSIISFTNYRESVAKAFNDIGAGGVLAGKSRILIKPNLVDDIPYPVTTPPVCVEAISTCNK